jgi:hypothetical protein
MGSPDGPGTWLWPGAAMVTPDGGSMIVFDQEYSLPPGSTDQTTYTWTGRDFAARLSLPDLVTRAVTPIPGGAGVAWGTAVLPEADAVYVYGVEDTGGTFHVKYTHLARFAPDAGPSGRWMYWDGNGWNPDPASSVRLRGTAADPTPAGPAGQSGQSGGSGPGRSGGSGPSAAPAELTGTTSAVVRSGAGYLLLSVPDLSHEVTGRLSCSPAGPWGPARNLYVDHPPAGDKTYLARAYPAPDGDGLTVAYSSAPDDPARLFDRRRSYVPRFLRLR